MKPAIFNIDFTQENDYSITVAFQDGNGDAFDYHLLTFTGKSKEQADTAITWDWVIDQTNANTGIVVFSLPNATTLEMPDVVEYEFRMESSELFTFMAGSARIRRSLYV